MDETTLEFLKSRASILPETSAARELIATWIESGTIDESGRCFLAFELLMRHAWDVEQIRAVLRMALDSDPG